MLPDRALVVHRVERRDAGGERRRQIEQLGDVLEHLLAQPPEFFLRQPQRRHDRRALDRIARQDRLELRLRGGGELNRHRKTFTTKTPSHQEETSLISFLVAWWLGVLVVHFHTTDRILHPSC